MSRPVEGLLMALSGLVALTVGFWVVAFDAPVFFGLVVMDVRDPDRPGGLKALTVSPFAFLLHIALALGCLYLAVRLGRGHRAKGALPAA